MHFQIPPSPFARKSASFRRAGTPLSCVGKSLFIKGLHQCGCLLALLPDDLTSECLALGRSIPDAQLGPGGREKHPHITVLYGFQGHIDLRELKAILIRHGPIPIKLGRLSLFEGWDQKDGEVLKLDVESSSLHELNSIVSSAFPCVDTHPEYYPHITIAYLKPEHSQFWAGQDFPLQGQEFLLEWCEYSSASGVKELIPLSGSCCFSCTEGKPCEGEKAFTGKKEDSLGRDQCYSEGRHVSCATGSEAPSMPSAESAYVQHFKVPDDVPSSFRKDQDAWSRTVTEDEKNSILLYTSSGRREGTGRWTVFDYKEFNEAVRKCPDDLGCLTEDQKAFLDTLSGMATRSKLTEPVTCYRGILTDAIEDVDLLLNKMREALDTGKVVPFYGIVSTTLDRSVAAVYGNMVFKIKAKTGAYIEPFHLMATNSGRKVRNYELIQAHGTRYRVKAINEHLAQTYDDMMSQADQLPREFRNQMIQQWTGVDQYEIELEEV